MSTIDSSLSGPISPIFHRSSDSETPIHQSTISHLSLQAHPEGGYYNETDRDSLLVPNPFQTHVQGDATRNASTTIYYYLTPKSPMGVFHRNKGRTVHTLHRGRGRYVLIHADDAEAKGGKAKVETFVVGSNVEKGERLQWIVDGGKYKASFLLEDIEGTGESGGLLISETVVPGFEFKDHDFCTTETFDKLVPPEQQDELRWLLRGSSEAKANSLNTNSKWIHLN